ncbi:MAG: hypothetical protein K2X44_01550, partial [Magnetospirillum sp.]|nr:hypothetical protein [Magnetospirillum sp.]
AGPLTEAEVPARPAFTGSADLWLAGSARSASPVCFIPRAVPRSVRGLSPRKVINSFVMSFLLSQSTT